MTTSDTCRHGLLTYERDGQSFHRYDGSRCETAPKPTPSRVPEPLAYQRIGEGHGASPAPQPSAVPANAPSFAPTPAQTGGPPAAFEPGSIEPAGRPSTTRRARPWRVAGAALAALVLLAGGVGIGFAVRSGTLDQQHRRAAAANNEIAALHDRVSSQQATIDDQQRQIATSRELQDQLKRRNSQLTEQASRTTQPAGANATSFTDGLYQSGAAIQAGQYHTDGSDTCYWAKLSTGDTNSIIENHVGAGPQTVTIDSPYFESEGCGSWTKVG